MTPPPPEWAPVERIYTAWPWRRREWLQALDRARTETAGLVRAIAGSGTPVTLLTRSPDAEAEARSLVGDSEGVDYRRARYGDIWLRDTGPVFLGKADAASFRFNGWGGKFLMPGDERVARQVARWESAELREWDAVLEGGAIDHDGTGTVITTEECLLNANRNPGLSRAEIEHLLREALGFERVVWLGSGLRFDHTDGHVDNLARFVAPGRVALPEASSTDDPNHDIFENAANRLEDAGIETVRIPSVGRFIDENGTQAPASYMNFLLTDKAVLVPLYGVGTDEAALERYAALFPAREAIGLPAKAILSGGGAFHCMTCHVPA
ncbi:agmatine deiminase [Pacificimonas flava]|uniref:Agmatine deiminase n=2 Tax=Pacificimonas TaxID=1960290 RepID=A0A219B7D9_9SPHN|nr:MULTISPECIES: agmatine deiminase family protein [Pacificimonas]MBZ6379076.1 agmatine deiminase family protein [Pacificimonas aurantium]OWV33688.1 agmatine deiminase [Pacificimonas flava]